MSSRLLFVSLLAALVAAPSTLAEKPNPQEEGAALLARAAELSNLRCPGCPPFRLRGQFRIRNQDRQETVVGTYDVIWVSPVQWREEIAYDGFRQVRVGTDRQYWQERNLNYKPDEVFDLQNTLEFVRRLKLNADETVSKVVDHHKGKALMKCVETKAKKKRARRLCLDSTRGWLLHRAYPAFPGWDVGYEYSEYVAVGEKAFPQVLLASGGTEVRLDVIQIKEGIEPSLFVPQGSATLWSYCEDPEPAKATNTPYPPHSMGPGNPAFKGMVKVYAVIGADGGLSSLALIRGVSPEFDTETLETLKTWRYQPAMCGGVAVPSETLLYVGF